MVAAHVEYRPVGRRMPEKDEVGVGYEVIEGIKSWTPEVHYLASARMGPVRAPGRVPCSSDKSRYEGEYRGSDREDRSALTSTRPIMSPR